MRILYLHAHVCISPAGQPADSNCELLTTHEWKACFHFPLVFLIGIANQRRSGLVCLLEDFDGTGPGDPRFSELPAEVTLQAGSDNPHRLTP